MPGPSPSPRPRAPLEPREAVARLAAGDRDRDVLRAVLTARGEEQEALFALARRRRDERFPSREVEVRSVVELSNACTQGCRYCPIGSRSRAARYALDRPQLERLSDHLHARGRRHLLLESGENRDARFAEQVAGCVAAVKARHPDLRITLCLGSLRPQAYRRLREAGADGYVLKFETSNPALYSACKPRDALDRRLACLESLLAEGFRVGSGSIVGLPGQSLDDVVGDLLLLDSYPLAMQSATPFIPGEGSEWAREPMGDVDVALDFIAAMRILHPERLVPTTSALERARAGGQRLGLLAGANVITVHDGTPEELRPLFPIYSTRRFTPDAPHLAAAVRGAGLGLPEGWIG